MPHTVLLRIGSVEADAVVCMRAVPTGLGSSRAREAVPCQVFTRT